MIEITEYKGRPVIVLRRNKDDEFFFSFGFEKAKLVVENIEEIKNFVNKLTGKVKKPEKQKEK